MLGYVVMGQGDDDIITLGAGDDEIEGGAGGTGGAGDDVTGGAGDDTITGGVDTIAIFEGIRVIIVCVFFGRPDDHDYAWG